LPPYQATLNVPGEVAVWANIGDPVIAAAARTTEILLMQVRFMTFPSLSLNVGRSICSSQHEHGRKLMIPDDPS
jgi:hypothetical protein